MSGSSISDASRIAIRSFFEETGKRIFKTRELQKAINGNRSGWGVPSSTSFEQIVECAALTKTRLAFPSRPETRYVKEGVSAYQLALAVKSDSYLTHYTALHLNGLLDQEHKDIFVNSEQSPKPRGESSLKQETVDGAFQRKPRTTNNFAEYEERKIYLLSGKSTGCLARSGRQTDFRITETWRASPRSVFHFHRQIISVARSTHAGLPWLLHIRREVGDLVHFWPFDGWQFPKEKNVIAEVSPLIFRHRHPQPILLKARATHRSMLTPDRLARSHQRCCLILWAEQCDRPSRS